jgi:hypothetical protein
MSITSETVRLEALENSRPTPGLKPFPSHQSGAGEKSLFENRK